MHTERIEMLFFTHFNTNEFNNCTRSKHVNENRFTGFGRILNGIKMIKNTASLIANNEGLPNSVALLFL